MLKDKIYIAMKKHNINIETDVFEYGYGILTTYLKYLTIIIPLAILLKEFTEVLLFVILFIPVRRYIGGFHFDNLNHCFFGSVILAVSLPYMAMRITLAPLAIMLIILSTFLITICIGAVDHPNKQLTQQEKKAHTHKTLFIEVLYLILMIVSYICQFEYLIQIIALTFSFCSLSLLISKFYKK